MAKVPGDGKRVGSPRSAPLLETGKGLAAVARVVERLGLRLIDPEQIQLRALARAKAQTAKAEGRAAAKIIGQLAEHAVRSIQSQDLPDDQIQDVMSQWRMLEEFRKIKKLMSVLVDANHEIENIDAEHSGKLQIPSDDFLYDWKSGAENVPDDELLRQLWARLLIEEMQNVGAGSRRTMEALKLMSPNDARVFAKLGPLIWNRMGFMKPDDLLDLSGGRPKAFSGQKFLEKNSIAFGDLIHLQQIGLISNIDSMGLAARPTYCTQGDIKIFELEFCRRTRIICEMDDKSIDIAFPYIPLSPVGREIIHLGEFEEDQDYIDTIVDYIKRNNPKAIYTDSRANGRDPTPLVELFRRTG